jgi:hypothetical protein
MFYSDFRPKKNWKDSVYSHSDKQWKKNLTFNCNLCTEPFTVKVSCVFFCFEKSGIIKGWPLSKSSWCFWTNTIQFGVGSKKKSSTLSSCKKPLIYHTSISQGKINPFWSVLCLALSIFYKFEKSMNICFSLTTGSNFIPTS